MWCSITFIVYNIVFLIFSLLLIKTNTIKGAEHYCWINSADKGGTTLTILVYAIRWVAIGVSIVFSSIIACKMNSLTATLNEETKQIKALWLKLVAYPIIQVIGAIIPTIFRILSLDSKPLRVLTLFLGTIQGLLFPLCHGYSSGLISYILKKKPSSDAKSISLQEQHHEEYLTESEEDSAINLSIN